MYETEMPPKREFSLIPSTETVAKLVVNAIKYTIFATVFWLGGAYTLSYAGLNSPWLWPWNHPGVAEAATTQPARAAEVHAANPPSRIEHEAAPVAAGAAPQLTAEQFEQLRADVCHSLGKEFVFEDGHCYKPRPKAWSAEGIQERGAEGHPLPEAGKLIKKLASGLMGTGEQAQEDEPPAPRGRPSLDTFMRHSDNVEDRRNEHRPPEGVDDDDPPPQRTWRDMTPGLVLRSDVPPPSSRERTDYRRDHYTWAQRCNSCMSETCKRNWGCD